MSNEQHTLYNALLKQIGLPEPFYEYKFHPARNWRFDVAFPAHKIAIEFEGGIYKIGRHQRPSGFMADIEKYNEAVILGWRVLRVPTHLFKTGEFDVYLLLERLINP